MPGLWTLDQVAQEIRRNANKRTPVRTALLVGAGCSYQAGIPLAQGFVDEIKARFPDEYERAEQKTYPYCMGELSASDRHDLISEFIDKAKVNLAHISIAQLMRAGFVDRVLTTNFDPLVRRACGLLNVYPAVYDMAVVRRGFVADFVRSLAVFHLHGQRDGFVQLHRKEEVDALSEAIEPLFDDTARNRCWVVVGYSGTNDPVFRALADRPEFPNRLFWVGYRDEEPPADFRAALLDQDKDVHWIKGYDPDTFLVQLTSRLECFPPSFFAKPFSHLLECFGTLAGFRLPGQDQDLDWAARARGWIQQAVATFEVSSAAAAAARAMAAPAETVAAAPAASPSVPASAPAPAAPAGVIEIKSAIKPVLPSGAARASAEVVTASGTPRSTAPVGADTDIISEAWVALMAGDYESVLNLEPVYQRGEMPELAEPIVWSLTAAARVLTERAATTAQDRERAELLDKAKQYAERATAVRASTGKAPPPQPSA